VAINRLYLQQHLNLKTEPLWLNQTHGNGVLELNDSILAKGQTAPEADGVWTKKANTPCLVLTADCLPILLCNGKGTVVSALHCGWRSIACGIIQKTAAILQNEVNDPIMAWLGPAISQDNYQVGEELREVFLKENSNHRNAFRKDEEPGKWRANLYQLAKNCLAESGITAIYGGEYCTFRDKDDFYSFRRQGKQSGSIGTLIYIAP
jgi:YfiH family protein